MGTNKSDKKKQELLRQQQAADRARLDQQMQVSQQQQTRDDTQNQLFQQLMAGQMAFDRGMQERLMAQGMGQQLTDRRLYENAMDNYIRQQAGQESLYNNLTNRGLQQEAEDRLTYRQLSTQAPSQLERSYEGQMADWFNFMNRSPQQPPQMSMSPNAPAGNNGSAVQMKGGTGEHRADVFREPVIRIDPRESDGTFNRGDEQQNISAPQPPQTGSPVQPPATSFHRDYSNAPGLIDAGRYERALQNQADRRTAFGAARIAQSGGNATVLAQTRQVLDAQAQQRQGAGIASAVRDRGQQMRSQVMPFLGFQNDRRLNLAAMANNNAQGRLGQMMAQSGQNSFGGAANIASTLGGLSQSGYQNLTNLATAGAQNSMNNLYGTTANLAGQGRSNLLGAASGQSQNSTAQYMAFQPRPSGWAQVGTALLGGAGSVLGAFSGGTGGGISRAANAVA